MLLITPYPDADPEYYFAKKFKESMTGYTRRSLKLVCFLNQEGAKIKWYKDGKSISVSLVKDPWAVPRLN